MSQITAVILGSGGAGPILTLTGNSGGAVPPTAGNINVVGSGIVSVAGNPGTSTLTISVTNPIPIANGGTNATSMATTDGVVYFDGTRLVTTGVGVATQVLTSNGPGMAPTFQAAGGGGGGITSITGDSGGAQSGPAITLTGGTSGGTFAGAANTLTMAFTELNLPTTSDSSHGVININSVPALQMFGTHNVFLGGAGNFTTTAIQNFGAGSGSLGALTTDPGGNVGLGYQTLANQTVSTLGGNMAIGQLALFSFTGGAGGNNVAIGANALDNLLTGAYNLAMGSNSGGPSLTGAESSNILLNAPAAPSASNRLQIGNGTGTGNQQLNSAFISGIFGKTVGVSGVPVVVDNADQLGTVVSSRRYKDNIEDMDDYSDEIMDLRCVRFNYKNHSSKDISVGLIAEEVEDIMPNLVVKDLQGRPETVRYLDLIPMLLNEVQKLKKTIDDLESRLEDLE